MRSTAPVHTALLLALLAPAVSPAADVGYNDLEPILAARCVMCHQGPAAPLGLRLDSLDGLLAGSRNGPVAVAGDPEASELIRRLKGTSLPRMPMTGPPFLGDAEIALFEEWIAQGMPAGTAASEPGAAPAEPPPPTPEPAPAPAEPPPSSASAEPPPSGPVAWNDVAVVFATRCAKCHTENGQMGPAPEGYRLTSYAAALSAGERARIVPGNPAASELMRRILGQSKPRMPFDGPPYLSAGEIELIGQWIADGARNSRGEPAPLPAGREVRLHGTLESGGRLDGLPLTITRETRIDKQPRPGDYVQVRGRIAPDGSIIVERLRRR